MVSFEIHPKACDFIKSAYLDTIGILYWNGIIGLTNRTNSYIPIGAFKICWHLLPSYVLDPNYEYTIQKYLIDQKGIQLPAQNFFILDSWHQLSVVHDMICSGLYKTVRDFIIDTIEFEFKNYASIKIFSNELNHLTISISINREIFTDTISFPCENGVDCFNGLTTSLFSFLEKIHKFRENNTDITFAYYKLNLN